MRLYKRLPTAIFVIFMACSSAFAQDGGWPRTVLLDEGMVTIYAPQLEAMNDGVLYYRAALAYRPGADEEPVFGAGWLRSNVDVDEEDGIVRPAGIELTQTRFPDGTADIQAELATALTRQSSGWNLDFSVAELEAALDAAEAESLSAQKLRNTPPQIIYRDRPAVLVSIDGDPVLREIEDSPYEAVVNTPFPMITDGKTYYLNAARGAWYRADTATGPYRFDNRPPADIVSMVEAAEERARAAAGDEGEAENPATDQSAPQVTAENAPEIVVSTVPAELIVTEGPADFAPLVDDLLVLKNSASDVFFHVDEQKYYIVLSGRWYQSASLNGPWENQKASALPVAFTKIPTDSAQADSRVYVAGTPEAEDAVLDAQVPQTAAVKRGQVDIDVEYDGEPDFEPVEGTEDLRYARNTGATVLESERIYYLLEDGVWYVSSSPHGPWAVSDHRPGELETIEPSSPVYNTKYVYVYDSTPEVVYVGYTPGYLGSYVYGPTLVYGTGYYYRPWVSPYYYYPRVSTWGFSVGYSDWGGWSFGIGWNYGGWNLNYYSGGYWHYGQPWYNRYWGYWGPRGYCPTPYYGYGYRHHRYAYNPYGKRYGYRRGYRHGYDDGWHDGYGRQRHRNLYRDGRQRARIADTRDVWNNDPDFRNDPGPGHNRNRRGEQNYADNRKIRQNRTGPVNRKDLHNKARVRDANQAARQEPMIATNLGDVQRATVGPSQRNRSQRDAGQRMRRGGKTRENQTGPVSRREIRDRGDMVASRSGRNKTSRGHSVTEPSRSLNRGGERRNRQSATEPERRSASNKPGGSRSKERDRQSRQQVTGPAREVSSRASGGNAERQAATQRREVQRGERTTRNNREAASAKRERRSNDVTRPSRQSVTQPRQQHRRSSSQKPARQTSRQRNREPARQVQSRPQQQQRSGNASVSQARHRAEPQHRPQQSRQKSRAPARQVNRTPSRPQTSSRSTAPRQSAPAPRPQVRSTPQRSAPQRSKPPRSNAGRSKGPSRGNGSQRKRDN